MHGDQDEALLTKSEFLAFRECAKSLWLRKRRSAAIEWPAPQAFDRLLMEDGYAVERAARALIEERPDGCSFRFQVSFADGSCLARADCVRENGDGTIELYEVKSSTSVDEHLVDACFQRIVAERSGQAVSGSFIIHVDPDYRRDGAIDLGQLLRIVNVDGQVQDVRREVEQSVAEALDLMAKKSIDEDGCDCILKSRGRRCHAFRHFNPSVPSPSIHDLPRMGGKRLSRLVDQCRLSPSDVKADEVTLQQLPHLRAMQEGGPVIDREAIADFLGALTYPLAFYDYETAGSAIPQADGHGPHEQIPVQFSCHVLGSDGTLIHHEFLAEGHGQEDALLERLQQALIGTGTAIAWNKSFEMACNRRMARLRPPHASFLCELNDRTQDLMVPFGSHYVHPEFGGSASIKKVLPVCCPDLRYSETAVHDGTGAILAFRALVDGAAATERERLRAELLDYCRLDTLAMVRLHEFLTNAVLTKDDVGS